MAQGLHTPWCYWRCPVCEGEGVFAQSRLAMRCLSCGELDCSSEVYMAIVGADQKMRAEERRYEAERVERQRIADAQKVKISPKEWAD